MLISDSKKFIFVHITKSAGNSVLLALRSHCLERQTSPLYSLIRSFHLPWDYRKYRFRVHERLSYVQKIVPGEVFETYFKFAFVRNPWDRLVSEYNALMHKPHHRRYGRVVKKGGFPEYLRYEAPRIVTSQVDMLMDATGKIGVDFTGKFENLRDDFQKICRKLEIEADLPHNNRHAHSLYQTFYDKASREFVREYWAKDIEAFGYEF